MYLRFVVQKKDEDSGRRQGLFQAMATLEDQGALLPHEQAVYEEIYEWFKKNLRKPRSFSRSSKPHARKVSLSWFKDSATAHIGKMHALVQILEAHGVAVDVIRTGKPGYVVYEDQFQVSAEPFSETVT